MKSFMILKPVIKNYFSDFLTKIFCGYGSFEHPKQMFNCCLMISFSNFLDPYLAYQNTRPGLDPNCLALF